MVSKFRKNGKIKRFMGIFFSVLVGALFLAAIAFLIYTDIKINKKRVDSIAKIDSLKIQISDLEKKNDDLKQKTSETGAKEYLEGVARDQLGLKKPGEEAVVIKEENVAENKATEEKQGWWEWLKGVLGK
jgi:cell division protein FtsL